MNSDRMEGALDKAVGKVQEMAGDVLDDPHMRVEGTARQVTGAAQNLYGQASDQIRDVACEVADCVQRNPLSAVLIAGAVGFLLGWGCRGDKD